MTTDDVPEQTAHPINIHRTDDDKALAALIEPLLPCMPDQASSLLSLKIARVAREHIEAEQKDALRERLKALTEDVDEAEKRAKAPGADYCKDVADVLAEVQRAKGEK